MRDIYYRLWDDYWRTNRINSEAAIQIASERVPGRVEKVRIDYKNNLLIYEVDIRNDTGLYKVEVNADTGKILKIERKSD